MKIIKTQGLIAAPFTPFNQNDEIKLDMIEQYAKKLQNDNVIGVFISGTSGEGMLLNLEERKALTEEWCKYATDNFKVIVHVGSTSYSQSRELAEHAAESGAQAIAAMGPPFLQPASVNELVAFCTLIALAAPELPFYYYHIPSISGVALSMPDFLNQATEFIPNLAGIKFTHNNFMELYQCLYADEGKWDILHGYDEVLLAGLTFGVQGAVGSTYNYMAPVYNQIIKAFQDGDIETAREYQRRSVEFVKILIKYGGGLIGGKGMMKIIGMSCGSNRLPNRTLSQGELVSFEMDLKKIGFFDWIN